MGEEICLFRFYSLQHVFQLRFVFFGGSLYSLWQFEKKSVQFVLRIGMACHGRVSQHGFRPCCRHCDKLRFARFRIDNRVADVPEMSPYFFIDNFIIADCCLELTIPVDQTVSPKNQTVAEQSEKSLPDRPCADRIHGETHPAPITRASDDLQLCDDPLLVFILPGPDSLHQSFAADILPRFLFQFIEPFFNHGLRCDSGMVGARHPERIIPFHPVPADEEVLHDIVHGVAHVQGTGHIGQGHHDDVGVFSAVRNCGKGVGVHPLFINLFFIGGKIKMDWEIFRFIFSVFRIVVHLCLSPNVLANDCTKRT